jgi:hypothetical protein
MNVDPARVAEFVFHCAAVFAAWRRVRLGRVEFTPTLRPLWVFLLITLIADVVRWLGQHFVLQHALRPFTGFARVCFHVDQAGVIGWNAGLLAIVVLAFSERERIAPKLLPIASFAVGTVLSFGFAYPELRAEKLGVAYTIGEIATVLACMVFAAHAWFKTRWFGIAARAVSVLVVAEIATLLGPFLGEPFKNWATANGISAVAYAVLAWELRRSVMAAT